MSKSTCLNLKGATVASKTLIIGTAISITILLATMILFSLIDSRNRSRDQEDRLRSEIEVVQVFVSESYILGDFFSLRRYLDSYAKLSDWQSGRFIDNLGNEIWSLNRQDSPKYFKEHTADIKSAQGGKVGTLFIKKDTSVAQEQGKAQLRMALMGFIIIGLLGLLIQSLSLIKVLRPVSDLTEELHSEAKMLGLDLEVAAGKDEVLHIRKWFTQITESWRQEREIASQRSHFQGMAELASQVAHDIRSPISALNVILSSISGLPEDKRILIRSSVNRINDIANDLLGKSKNRAEEFGQENNITLGTTKTEMLSAIVDELVSEKRLQIRDKINISLEVDLNFSYGSFVNINPSRFKRALSNLINNSIEAVDNKPDGKVQLEVKLCDNTSIITIRDNGKGVAPEVLPRLGQRGFSFGKPTAKSSGSGLGLYHARTTIEAARGLFAIESTLNVGTTITITLPNAKTPAWFIDALQLTPNCTLVICDDDSSIHDLWKQRLESVTPKLGSIRLHHCTNSDQLLQWHAAHSDLKDIIYLVDFELLGSPKNGIELIDELALGQQAILVTSRHEEENILEKCLALKTKVIPKAVAGLIPIHLKNPQRNWDCVLIDDDSLVRMTWEMVAKAKGKQILTFTSAEEFWSTADKIARDVPIYVDVNLGQGRRGDVLAQEIVAKGFDNVSLATGFEPNAISSAQFEGKVVGKDFPL